MMYKHYMDNNEDADFKDRHICILIAKTNISTFSDVCLIPNKYTVCLSAVIILR